MNDRLVAVPPTGPNNHALPVVPRGKLLVVTDVRVLLVLEGQPPRIA